MRYTAHPFDELNKSPCKTKEKEESNAEVCAATIGVNNKRISRIEHAKL